MNIKENIFYVSNRINWFAFYCFSLIFIIITGIIDNTKLMNVFLLIFVILILTIFMILLEKKYDIRLGDKK